MDFSRMKVNKRKAPRHDHRTLQLGKYLLHTHACQPNTLPPVPDTFDWSLPVTSLQMWDNDTVGDCTCAAFANALAVWAANTGQPFNVTTADVIAMYSAISGYVPGDETTDTGCDPLDVLNYLRKTGLAGHKIGAFLSVNPLLPQELRIASYLGMGIYTSVELPLSAQTQSMWDVVGDGKTGPSEAGSWGGHEVWSPARDTTGIETVLTWATRVRMSPAFAAKYASMRYVIISQDQLNGVGQTPYNINMDQLKADLQQVTA